jgi:hypothetical protein
MLIRTCSAALLASDRRCLAALVPPRSFCVLQYVIPATKDDLLGAAARWTVTPPVRDAGYVSATRPYGAFRPEFETKPAQMNLGSYVGQDVVPLAQAAAFSSAAAALLGSWNMTRAAVQNYNTPPPMLTGRPATDPADQRTLDDFAQQTSYLAGNATTDGLQANPRCEAALQECAEIKITDWLVLPKLVKCMVTLAFECYLEPLSAFADLAPCAAPGPEPKFADRNCAFPKVRFADGGYVDNAAVAQTVAQMQADGGSKGKTLRVIVSANLEVYDGAVHNRTDVAGLFKLPGREPGKTYLAWPGLPAPSQQIMATPFADIEWSLVPLTKYTYTAHVKTTTVDNPIYGVVSGQAVDVLLLSLEGPIPLTVGIQTSDALYHKMGLYAEDATHPNVVELVHKWFHGQLDAPVA